MGYGNFQKVLRWLGALSDGKNSKIREPFLSLFTVIVDLGGCRK
nr:MAG TPA: hypothetical protein [Caudoviricetes sp.]